MIMNLAGNGRLQKCNNNPGAVLFFTGILLCNYETMLTITSKTITTANALIPDLIEWGLSSWLNMDI